MSKKKKFDFHSTILKSYSNHNFGFFDNVKKFTQSVYLNQTRKNRKSFPKSVSQNEIDFLPDMSSDILKLK